MIRQYLLVSSLLLALAACDRPRSSPSPSTAATALAPVITSAKLPDWSYHGSDPSSLAAPFSIGPFEIRPPATFRYVKDPSQPEICVWGGPVRPDENFPTFMVIVQQIPTPSPYPSIDAAFQDVLNGVHTRFTNWSAAPTEHGIINGLEFLRASWIGTATSTARKAVIGRAIHGFVYFAIQDNQAVQIHCFDNDPDQLSPLKLAEISASTFQQSPTANELKSGIENKHPATYYTLAGKLFRDGNKDEAVFWFYLGQLRYRFYLAASAGLDPSGDPALLDSLSEVVGRPVNEYAFGDIPKLAATIDKVLEWDAAHENGFTPKKGNEVALGQIRDGLIELKNMILKDQDKIKAQRKENGL